MLLGAGSILRGKNGADRQLRWFGAAGVLGMIYATGWLLPLTISLPGFSYFSGPGRFGLLTTLAAALWAARGWEVLKSCSPLRLRGVLWTIVFVGSLLDLSWVSQRITYAFMVPETP